MYVGIDFLWDGHRDMYVSEVNTGLPAGATEYDLVYRQKFGQSPKIFEKIQSLSEEVYHLDFPDYIAGLPWLEDLRLLKIWMDGKGPFPEDPHPFLKLEDKWIQYMLLKNGFPMIPTLLLSGLKKWTDIPSEWKKVVLKRRLGRGGCGLSFLDRSTEPEDLALPSDSYLVQPLLHSRLGTRAFSVRAAAFAGRYLCMFASLGPLHYSNHGTRFYVSPGDKLRFSRPTFRTKIIEQKSWEADLFYGGRIPDYLHHDTHIEQIGDTDLVIPHEHFTVIQKIAASISAFYMNLNIEDLSENLN